MSSFILFKSYYYKRGYRAAQKLARLYPADKNMFTNPKPFLDTVYKEVVSGMVVHDEEDLSLVRIEISKLEKRVEELRKEEEGLVVKVSNPDINNLNDDFQDRFAKLTSEIESLGKRIDALNLELAEVQKEQVQESTKEKRVKTLHSEEAFSILKQKISRLVGETSPLLGLLLLVFVDYGIAVSFFKDLADGTGPISYVVIGFLVPLVITIISMSVIHIGVEQYRKAKNTDYDLTNMATSIGAFMFFAITVAYMLYIRIIHNDGDLVSQILIWLLFIGLVLTVAYKLDKDNKDALSLITTPLFLIGNFIGTAVVIVLWPFEKVYTLLTNDSGTTRNGELQKHITFLKDKITQHTVEKDQKEKQRVSIPKDKTQYRLDQIEHAKREARALFEAPLKKLQSLINESESTLIKYKASENKLKHNLLDIRHGSNDGSMIELYKKLKMLEKQQGLA